MRPEINSFSVDDRKFWYVTTNLDDKNVNMSNLDYLCNDFVIRAWKDTVTNYGADEANNMIIHEDLPAINNFLEQFREDCPEYFV